jgi:hypothetical protein
MEIISHRGYWILPEEKNSVISFLRSFQSFYGTVTDIRDYNQKLVVSHDVPNETSIIIDDLFKLYENNKHQTLALNIKSDGLAPFLLNKLTEYQIENYFVFDMSIPDTISYLKYGLKVMIRQSEYEKDLPFYNQSIGIWLDSFISEWYDEELIKNHIGEGKKVCIVSSELHNRQHIPLWEMLKETGLCFDSNVILCTDKPTEATNFFKI